MLIAELVRGPYDSERMILPADREDPWARIVIPRFGKITIEFIYLRAGRLDDSLWAYLFDDLYTALTDPEQAPM